MTFGVGERRVVRIQRSTGDEALATLLAAEDGFEGELRTDGCDLPVAHAEVRRASDTSDVGEPAKHLVEEQRDRVSVSGTEAPG